MRKILLKCLALILVMPAVLIPGIQQASAAGIYCGWNPQLAWASPIAFSDGTYERYITLPNGQLIGYSKNWKMSGCSGWVEHMVLTDTKYTWQMSIWHPGDEALTYFMGPWKNSWQNTAVLDITPGVQNCAGAQIYVRNGNWVKWQFLGCWTS